MVSEKELLVDFLDTQREHVLGILEGLSDEDLRRPVLPSGWSCLGLVKHLAYGVEHFWIRRVVGGESVSFFEEHGLDHHREWRLAPGDTGESIFALYREEIRRANEIIEATSLDEGPRHRDESWGDWPVDSLRFILLHMIEETACHAGHLDIVRELIDHRQWFVFPDELV
jgi:uncharacterized damage-inducible protein DinB